MTKVAKFLSGQHVYLRCVVDDDALNIWYEWLNDVELVSLLGRCPKPLSPKHQIEYLTNVRTCEDRVIFGVCDKSSNNLIGIASLSGIDRYHQSAQTGLFIGDKRFRGMSHALEALALLTEIGLVHMNLRRLDASALSLNEGSHNLNKALGWNFVGIKRKSHFYRGDFVDSTLYEILRDDWVCSEKRPDI